MSAAESDNRDPRTALVTGAPPGPGAAIAPAPGSPGWTGAIHAPSLDRLAARGRAILGDAHPADANVGPKWVCTLSWVFGRCHERQWSENDIGTMIRGRPRIRITPELHDGAPQ